MTENLSHMSFFDPKIWEPPDCNGNIWGRKVVWCYEEPDFHCESPLTTIIVEGEEEFQNIQLVSGLLCIFQDFDICKLTIFTLFFRIPLSMFLIPIG